MKKIFKYIFVVVAIILSFVFGRNSVNFLQKRKVHADTNYQIETYSVDAYLLTNAGTLSILTFSLDYTKDSYILCSFYSSTSQEETIRVLNNYEDNFTITIEKNTTIKTISNSFNKNDLFTIAISRSGNGNYLMFFDTTINTNNILSSVIINDYSSSTILTECSMSSFSFIEFETFSNVTSIPQIYEIVSNRTLSYFFLHYGQIKYEEGYFNGQTTTTESSIITIFSAISQGLINLLSLEILPHLTIGVVCSIPLAFGVILLILKLVKGD